MAFRGKIGRLPHQVREELNQRLHDSEDGRRLVDWLNQQVALADVRRLTGDAGEVEQAVGASLSDRFATWLAALPGERDQGRTALRSRSVTPSHAQSR